MQAFTKVVRVGRTRQEGSVYAKIVFNGNNLSITGVIGPKRNGDALGSFGQIVMSAWDIVEYAPGWSNEITEQFRAVWDEWHLSDMCAGSPKQSQYLKDHPVTDRLNYFTKACEALAAAGLNPDPSYLHNGKPYRYGSAWLSKDVPESVLAFLAGLPDADSEPAWV